MKNKNGLILMSVGLVLFLSSIALNLYNRYDEKRAMQSAESLLSHVEISSEEKDRNEIPDYILNPNMPMPTKSGDGIEYIGVLEIDAINMKMPIISQCDNSNLKVAPCRYSGSAYLDNMVIAGHNYRTHFGYISNLEKGDRITFTDVDGNEFNYEVMYIDILAGNETENMIVAQDWALSLFTCTYDGRSRITVRAKLV